MKTKLVKGHQLAPATVSERLMTLQIPLSGDNFITFASAYAPTLDADEDVNDQFYHQLNITLFRVPTRDRLILLGDFNARIGKDNQLCGDVMRKQGLGNCNANGLLLLGLCAEQELFDHQHPVPASKPLQNHLIAPTVWALACP